MDDDTKVWYTFRMTVDGTTEEQQFTSDDMVPGAFVRRIGYAWIESIKLEDDGWHVVLYED